jgi:DNA-binding CsgD family transcriptional regulator
VDRWLVAETLQRVAAPTTILGSSQALLVIDDDGVCAEASLGACRLLGVARDEVIGRHLDELMDGESRDRFRTDWPRLRDDGGQVASLALEASPAIRIAVTVTAGVLPGAHLIALERLNTGGRSSSGGTARPREPTPREREILALLANGATDVQIAELLNLSPATVQTHVRNAKAKMGARTRTQAVALALRRGLIPGP